jgi:ketopantoate reductase
MHLDILGAGRVGLALAAAARPVADVLLVDRTSGWERLADRAGVPLVVTPRNDDLPSALDRVPAARLPDLVLVQNGMLRTFLRARGLTRVSRGILFFAVAKRGDPIVAGAPSPFTGPRAAAVVQVLETAGVPARVVDGPAFAEVELEKLLWNSIFGLLGEVLQEPVEVSAERSEVAELVYELAPLAEAELGVRPDREAMITRMRAYARSIPGFQAGTKEWAWRGGWFVDAASRAGVALPLHTSLALRRG